MKIKDSEKHYQITPKGWMRVRLRITLPNNPDMVDEFWNDLTEFVRKRAASNGMDSGTPCLVFADGGHCITLEAVKVAESAHDRSPTDSKPQPKL